MKDHRFAQSLEVGAGGEALVLAFIRSLSSVAQAEDVSAAPEYRKIDVDFIVHTLKGDILYYELKTEPTAHKTKNLFFEFLSNEEYGTEGCFLYSEADYWISFVPQSGDLYIFPLQECRAYIKKSYKFYTKKRVRNIAENSQYHSVGYAVPIVDVCQKVPYTRKNIKDIVDYEYIEEDKSIGQSPEFRNIAWK